MPARDAAQLLKGKISPLHRCLHNPTFHAKHARAPSFVRVCVCAKSRCVC